MSKYRCPICGAAHKEQVANCRLCGQNMSPNAIPAYQQDVKQEIHTDKSIKGVALIGLGLVAAIILGAVIFGVVRPTKQLQQASDLITGERHDGWATSTSESGKFVVDLPGEVTQETITLAVTDTGKLNGAVAYVPLKSSPDTVLTVGSGPITLPTSPMSGPAAVTFLKETIGPKWAAANNLEQVYVDITETAVAGYPAILFSTPTAKLKLNGKDAFAQGAFVLKGSTLYLIQTISIYKDAEQQSHMLSTFGITG